MFGQLKKNNKDSILPKVFCELFHLKYKKEIEINKYTYGWRERIYLKIYFL